MDRQQKAEASFQLAEENRLLRQRVAKLEAKLAKQKEDLAPIAEQIRRAQGREEALKARHEEKTREFKGQIETFKTQLASYIDKNDQLLQIIEQKEFKHQSEREALSKQVRTLEARLRGAADERRESTRVAQDADRSTARISERLSELEGEVARLRETNRQHVATLEEKEQQRKAIERELEGLRSSGNLRANQQETALQKLRSENNELLRLLQEANSQQLRGVDGRAGRDSVERLILQQRTQEAEAHSLIGQLETARLSLKFSEEELSELREKHSRLFEEKARLFVLHEQVQINLNHVNEQLAETKAKSALRDLENKELEANVERLRLENRRLVAANFELESLLKGAQAEGQALRETNEALVTNLREEFSNTKNVSEKLTELNELRQRIELLDKEGLQKDQLIAQIQQRSDAEHRKDQRTLEAALQEGREKSRQFEEEIERLRRQLAVAQNDAADQRSQFLAELKKKEEQLKAESDRQTRANRMAQLDLEKQGTQLRTGVAERLKKVAQRHVEFNLDASLVSEASEDVLYQLEGVLDAFEAALADRERSIHKLDSALNLASQEKGRIQRSLEDLKVQSEARALKIKQLTQENAEIAVKSDTLQRDLVAAAEKISSLEKQNQSNVARAERAEAEMRKSFQSADLAEKRELESRGLQDEVVGLRSKVQRLTDDIGRLEAELAGVYQEKGMLSSNLKALKTSQARSQEEVGAAKREAEVTKGSLEAVSAELAAQKAMAVKSEALMKDRITLLEAERLQCREELGSMRSETERARREFGDLREEANRQRTRILELEGACESLQKALTSLQEKYGALERRAAEGERVEGSLKTLQTEKAELAEQAAKVARKTERFLGRLSDLLGVEARGEIEWNVSKLEEAGRLEEIIRAVQELQAEREQERKRAVAADLEAQRSKSEAKSIDSSRAAVESFVQTLKQTLALRETELSSKERELEQALDEHRRLQQQLEEIGQRHETQLREMALKNESMARGHSLLVSKVNDISTQMSAKVEEATREMRAELENAQAESRKLREQVALQQKKTALLQREIGEKERVIGELEEAHRKNMAVIQALSQSNQKIHEFKEQGAAAERELQMRSEKLTEVSAKLQELGGQYQAAIREIELLKEALLSEQRRGAELENGLTLKQRALHKAEEELRDIRRGLERAREVEGQERRCSQEAQVVIAELNLQIQRLVSEKQGFEMEKLRLIEVNEQMSNQLDRLQRDVDSKQKEVRSLQDVERQLVVEKSQRENMNNVLMYLMSQVDEPSYKRKKN